MFETTRKLERRYLQAAISGLAAREAKEGETDRIATLDGYAAVFDSLSEDLGGFREIIRPGAFKRSLEEGEGVDARAFDGHISHRIIGRRTAATLDLAEDDKGLKAEIALPDTSVGRDLVVSVKRGDLTGMSFGFFTVKDDWRWEKNADGDRVYRRELLEVEVFEVSVVSFPAYPDTSVEARARSTPEEIRQILEEGKRRLGTEARAASRSQRLFKLYKRRMEILEAS